MFTIIHTKNCTDFANALANRLEDAKAIVVDQALSDPESLDDFQNLGLVFENDEKSLPSTMQDFIRNVLGGCDLKGLEYMFSLCISDGKVGHALKIVEKLCAKVGCAPSLSLSLDGENLSEGDLDKVVNLVNSGEIRLAKGSIGTSIYMFTHGIKTRG